MPSDVGVQVAKDLLVRLGSAISVVQGATQALKEDQAPWRAALDRCVQQLDILDLWKGARLCR